MNAYLVSHNGMGDNLYMVGALIFLLKYYDKIFTARSDGFVGYTFDFFINKNTCGLDLLDSLCK